MAHTPTSSRRTPRRRTALVAGGALILTCAFAIRLIDIQVVNADELVSDSRAQTGSSRELAGQRGDIVDANGTVLARSTLTYDVAVDPCNLANADAKTSTVGCGSVEDNAGWPGQSEKIAEVTGQKADQLRDTVAKNQAGNAKSRYAKITSNIDTDQMMRLRALDLPYLSFESHESRAYPNGAVGGNMVGFVGSDAENRTVKAQAGVELMQNACLSSKNGSESFLRGTNGEMIPGSLKTKPAKNGGTVKLTLDADLQWYLQQMIGEETKAQNAQSGTVTVVEVATGKIRAAAEYPSVDGNDVGAADPEDRGSRIFRYTFEPGSTFKAATAAMLLDAGAATPTSTVQAPGSYTFPNGARVNDSFGHDTFNYTLAGALIDSSNVGLSMFGSKLSPQTRHDYLAKFGVGTPTGVGFLGEAKGQLPQAKDWDNQSIYTTTFGQHFTVTAAQVASFYQAIANDGVRQPLQLVESCTGADGKVVKQQAQQPERIIKSQSAKELQRMIENVGQLGPVSDSIKVPGYRVAAKTGTAQLYDPKHGGYLQGVYFTSIVGFAPADDPKYVVVVTLDQPLRERSSTATASAFQKAVTQVMKTYHVMPSATPFTDPLPKYGN